MAKTKGINELEEGLLLDLQFDKREGLLPVAVQETSTGQILMLASVNREALTKTMDINMATFWSTSRNALWTKGETSGDYLQIDKIFIDCDQDAVVYKVTLLGDGVCHTYNTKGEHRKTCFYRELDIEGKKLQFIEGME